MLGKGVLFMPGSFTSCCAKKVMKLAHCCRFMLDDMLSLQGNTAVYLLYAHARIAAIGRKAGIDNIAALAHDHPVEVDHEKERNLAMHVSPPPLINCQFLWLA